MPDLIMDSEKLLGVRRTHKLAPSREALEVLANGLSDAQRERLLDWPDHGSTFPYKLDAVALELCAMDIGVTMPWFPKGSRSSACLQMGLTSAIGIPLHLYLKGVGHGK